MIDILRGDFRFFWPESINSFFHPPLVWDASLNSGIGINDANTLWITSYLNFTSLFSHLGMSWFWVSLIFWFLPPLFIAFFGAYFLFKINIANNKLYAIIAGLIFSTNTYFLTILGGGQAGVAFAYSFIPIVFLVFLNVLKKENLKSSLVAGLVFSIQVLFDPRFAFLTAGFFALFYLLSSNFSKRHIKYLLIIPGVVVILLHSFWILPLILFRSQVLPQGYDSLASVKFLSFATIENTISLLHPNWPENIFGKIYFMKVEFLFLPILAFASLLLLVKSKLQDKKYILTFALLALLAAFLAKGTNEPFGELYIWIFKFVLGGNLFRDSTKFYSIVALSYSILIPFTLFKLSEKFVKKRNLILVVFILFWVFSLRLLFTPSVSTFRSNEIPESYNQLRNFIVSQNSYFRTLWVPQWQRYGYFSDTNPAIGRGEILKIASASSMFLEFEKPEFKTMLEDFSVKYIIVPDDSEGEIFVKDRKYDRGEYEKTILMLDKIPWLKPVGGFGKIAVFETSNHKDHFFFVSNGKILTTKMASSVEYRITVKNQKNNNLLVFSENFDAHWYIKVGSKKIYSQKFSSNLNSFRLPERGEYEVLVYYEPQKWVYCGMFVGAVTLFVIVFIVRKKR